MQKKVIQVLFCDLHSAVVLADNVWSSRQKYRPCVMVHRICWPILSFVWHPLYLRCRSIWRVQCFTYVAAVTLRYDNA